MAIDPKKPPVCDPDDVVPAREPKDGGMNRKPGGDPPPKAPAQRDPNVPGAPDNVPPPTRR
jgi:hypothetical protein